VLYSNEEISKFALLFYSRYGETELHIGQECMVSLGITFALIKNSIFSNKLSDIIKRLEESGLTRKWFTNAMDKVGKSRKSAQKPEHSPFTFSQLQVIR
jgi:hypothetical protein